MTQIHSLAVGGHSFVVATERRIDASELKMEPPGVRLNFEREFAGGQRLRGIDMHGGNAFGDALRIDWRPRQPITIGHFYINSELDFTLGTVGHREQGIEMLVFRSNRGQKSQLVQIAKRYATALFNDPFAQGELAERQIARELDVRVLVLDRTRESFAKHQIRANSDQRDRRGVDVDWRIVVGSRIRSGRLVRSEPNATK